MSEINVLEKTQVEEKEEIVIRGGKCYEFFKRVFDIFVSTMGIICLSWLLIIVGIMVKVTSKGPVLFKDIRVGKNGKRIKVYKFRSMYIDAEERMEQYLTNEQMELWKKEGKIDNDPRITKIGKFLRKTSLDELPQIFNIFFGTLSCVGPRPIKKLEMTLNYTQEQQKYLLKVKPGLTGYWQVYGRSNVDYASGKRQKDELTYLSKRGFWFDLKIMFLTIPAVLSSKGAQ